MDVLSNLLKLPSGWDDPTTWVIIALIAFLGVLAYLGVPGMITKALDKRAEDIANELEEARRLREEAQEVLAGYQRKQRAAEDEAREIVERARREADAIAASMREDLAHRLERRTALAEQKIAQAEADAAAKVRQQAAALAVAAAEKVLTETLTASERDAMVEASTADLATRLRAG